MVNMPAEVRCTSSGALSTDGSAKAQNQRHRAGEAEDGHPEHDPRSVHRQHADEANQRQRSGRGVSPRPCHQAAGDAKHQKSRRQLAEIDGGERAADEIGAPIGGHVVGQEGIGHKIGCIDAAENEAELPDQRPAPIRPPAATGSRCGTLGAAEARRVKRNKQCCDQNRDRPNNEIEPPAVVDERQDQRDGERGGEYFADQEPGRIDRGGKADAVRKPGAHQGRQRRLHDRDARRHHDGRRIEESRIGKRSTRRGTGGIEQQAHDQRRHDAETRDQHRARHRRDRKQHRRQAREPADIRLRQMQVGVQQRHHRRHRQDGQAQAGAGEPEQRKRDGALAGSVLDLAFHAGPGFSCGRFLPPTRRSRRAP